MNNSWLPYGDSHTPLPIDISTEEYLTYSILFGRRTVLPYGDSHTPLPMDISTVTSLVCCLEEGQYCLLPYSSKLEDLEALTMDI
jgi:hypothetical protein